MLYAEKVQRDSDYGDTQDGNLSGTGRIINVRNNTTVGSHQLTC